MGNSFLPLIRFRYLFILVIFVSTILLFQSCCKTFTSIGNNVTFHKQQQQGSDFYSDEERIFSSEGIQVDNHEKEIHSFTHKPIHFEENENGIQSLEIESENGLLKTTLSVLNNKSTWPTSLTELNSRLIQSFNSSSMV